MPKSVTRQQRRLAKRHEEKQKASSERAQRITARRVAAKEAWHNRHAIPRSPWQKFVLVCEVLFVSFGGPLIWLSDLPSLSRERSQGK